MIDAETAESGFEALSVAVAIIVEHAHEVATLATPGDSTERDRRSITLLAIGEDVAALAAAMAVLSRRSQQNDP